jgi:hypothetical protein
MVARACPTPSAGVTLLLSAGEITPAVLGLIRWRSVLPTATVTNKYEIERRKPGLSGVQL